MHAGVTCALIEPFHMHFGSSDVEKRASEGDSPHLLPLKEGGEGIVNFSFIVATTEMLNKRYTPESITHLTSPFITTKVEVAKRKAQMRSISLSSFLSRKEVRDISLICKFLLVAESNKTLAKTMIYSSF